VTKKKTTVAVIRSIVFHSKKKNNKLKINNEKMFLNAGGCFPQSSSLFRLAISTQRCYCDVLMMMKHENSLDAQRQGRRRKRRSLYGKNTRR
jgi:hypothetical protein